MNSPSRMCLLTLMTALGIGLLVSVPAEARYIRVEIENVPLERLARNLENLAKKEPTNSRHVVNLARVYAMAYTLKSSELPIAKGKADAGVWFGYEPMLVPFGKPKTTRDEEARMIAKKHLDKAIGLYKKALDLDPKDLKSRLGYGWTLDQAGKDDEAVNVYREVIDTAWMKEKDLKALGLGGHTFTAEAAGYLIPLLDKEKDREEIATLTERTEKLKKLPRPITPIAVPLRDGLSARDLEDRSAEVSFDADGTGLRRSWTWITADAAWLVHDPSRTGKVTSGLQLFGNVTFWLFWETGYDALAALDDNGDGDLRGEELSSLALWHDINGNGVSEPGEVKPLMDYGVIIVSCRYERDRSHEDIAFSRSGVTFRDGRTRATFDLLLHARPESR